MPEPKGVRRDDGVDSSDNEAASDSGGFALRVDLSGCVGAGSGAACRVWVRARGRRVAWLARRVRRRAGLRGALVLQAGGELLPPAEPLRLLRHTDTLSVIPVEHEWQRPFSFPDELTEPEPLPVSRVEPAPPASRLELEPAPPASQPDFKPEPTLYSSRPEFEPPAEPQPADFETLSRVKKRALQLLRQVAGGAAGEGEGEEEGGEGADEADAPRRRRRRVRRRRPAASPTAAATPVSAAPAAPLPASRMTSPPAPAPAAPSPPSCMTSPPPVVPNSSPAPRMWSPPPVVRNPSPARAPRVVRALPDPDPIRLAT